jgi:class 3 adenylate cyclase/CHASE2 domain-containing sensor protein
MKLPIKVRRLKILGTAMALSAFAAIIMVTAYFLPPQFASLNRIGDYVVLNDATFLARGTPWLASIAHFPDNDPPEDHIKLVTIDEASLQDPPKGIGQFPWPRHVFGDFLRKLAKAGAKVAVFDVEFFEHSHDPAQDASLLDGLRRQPSVLGMALVTTSGGILTANEPPADFKAAAHLGSTTVDNPGGWLVGQPLVITATSPAGRVTDYPSLALEAISYYEGVAYGVTGPWNAHLGNEQIPLDGDGKLLMIPFHVEEDTDQAESNGLASRAGASDLSMPQVDAAPFIEASQFDPDTMKAFAQGNIIVIGATAQASGDYILTPSGRFPGVFSNVRLMYQLLEDRFIRRVPPAVDIALIILMPLVIGFIVTQLPATLGVGLSLGIAFLYTCFAVGLYAYTLHWINLIHVDGAIIFSALFVALYRTITEGADKRVIREMFGKHVSPALVDQMLSHDDPLKALDLSGKRAKVTIFYTDIRGFTAMSEKMTPEQIYGQLNEYFEEMCKIVFAHGGYVDKFIGDCLMAVFAAPDPRPEDAYEATLCALEQQEKILEMMTEWGAGGRQIFTVGMGLNTGEVVMGNLGSSDRLNYTVIGDNVNTAARLYNVAKGGQIIISETTYNEVKDRFIVNELTPVSVKGKTLPLRNFEIIARLEPGQPNTSTILDPANLPEAMVAADH